MPVSVVAEIERRLAERRCADAVALEGVPEQRTSTMTHVAWAPPSWLPTARKTFAGLHERPPARTIFLVAQPAAKVSRSVAELKRLDVRQLTHEIYAEVIEIHLHGAAVRHPASVVLPLLISDLPAFCRWRGEPRFGHAAIDDLAGVVDRLIVDSSEWRNPRDGYVELAKRFDVTAISDLAFRRLHPWRVRLADSWPDVGRARRLVVHGPRAESLLLAGWLRSRLRRKITLTRRSARALESISVDGLEIVPPRSSPERASDLLSDELDVFGRDPVYEAAVRAAV
jgi:glucose-6-phosphate dehydrogenase assembly protein OpcA